MNTCNSNMPTGWRGASVSTGRTGSMTKPVNPSRAATLALQRKRELLTRIDAAGSLLDDLALLVQRVEMPETFSRWLGAGADTVAAEAREMLARLQKFNGNPELTDEGGESE